VSVQIINPPGGGAPVVVPVPSRPNLLRNGGFWFAQVRTPNALSNVGSTTLRSIAADGWGVTNENANTQYQRIDTNAAPEVGFGGRYYGKFLKITAAGKLTITQAVESVDCQPVRGETVRVQVWLKAIVAGATYRLGLLQLNSVGTVDTVPARDIGTWVSAWNAASTDPTLTAANNVAYIAPNAGNLEHTTVVGDALDCAVTTAWQRFGGTFTVPTDCHNLIVAIWSNAQTPVNDGILVANTSMTIGADIVDWTPLAYDLELLRCQRYILKSFDPDTVPAQTGGVANCLRAITGKSGAVTGALRMPWRFPVPLLYTGLSDASPFASRGITRYNPSAANSAVRNFTTGADMGAIASIVAGRNSLTVEVTGIGGGGGSGVGDDCGIHLLIFGEL